MKKRPWRERFWEKVDVCESDECWEWKAGRGSGGYAVFWTGEAMALAHRVLYEEVVGPVPYGLELDHLCRNRVCVNPAHLEAVTHQENVRRGDAGKVFASRQRAKTHCPRGHPYDEGNTYVNRGRRHCRACWRVRRQQQGDQG